MQKPHIDHLDDAPARQIDANFELHKQQVILRWIIGAAHANLLGFTMIRLDAFNVRAHILR